MCVSECKCKSLNIFCENTIFKRKKRVCVARPQRFVVLRRRGRDDVLQPDGLDDVKPHEAVHVDRPTTMVELRGSLLRVDPPLPTPVLEFEAREEVDHNLLA